MSLTPTCYASRRSNIAACGLVRDTVEAAGYVWPYFSHALPDAQVWRMDWFARLCDVHIDDIHAFEVASGGWLYCFSNMVRPFEPYSLDYLCDN